MEGDEPLSWRPDRRTALLGLGRYAEAVADLSRAVERSGEGRVERALAHLGLGDVANAAADLEEAAARTPRAWKERDRLRLLLWIVKARQGSRAAADAGLDGWFKSRTEASLRGWYRRVSEVLLGRLPEGDLRAVLGAQDAERACEADLYIGARRLLAGDDAAAREALQRAARTPARRDLWESLAAQVLTK